MMWGSEVIEVESVLLLSPWFFFTLVSLLFVCVEFVYFCHLCLLSKTQQLQRFKTDKKSGKGYLFLHVKLSHVSLLRCSWLIWTGHLSTRLSQQLESSFVIFGNVCPQEGVRDWDVCSGLPVVSESGSQRARRPAPSPSLWVSLVSSHRCSANSSPRPSCPLCSDSFPKGISAKATDFTYQASLQCDHMLLLRRRSSQAQWHWFCYLQAEVRRNEGAVHLIEALHGFRPDPHLWLQTPSLWIGSLQTQVIRRIVRFYSQLHGMELDEWSHGVTEVVTLISCESFCIDCCIPPNCPYIRSLTFSSESLTCKHRMYRRDPHTSRDCT